MQSICNLICTTQQTTDRTLLAYYDIRIKAAIGHTRVLLL